MGGFEGSFLGENSRLGPASVLECGVCWWIYDPAAGDTTWQIPPGTPFTELPDHWRCPNCDNAREQFMVVREDPGEQRSARPQGDIGLLAIRETQQALLQAHSAVDERMRSLPVYNDGLDIQVIGLRRWDEGLLGIVATPWCMNIILLPAAGAPQRMEGSTRELDFPSGRYAFITGQLPGIGAIESCSLFSPMHEFDDPLVVTQVAEHALQALFAAPGSDTGVSADNPEGPREQGMSRRRFMRGGRSPGQ